MTLLKQAATKLIDALSFADFLGVVGHTQRERERERPRERERERDHSHRHTHTHT
jgi:hypothetical protein